MRNRAEESKGKKSLIITTKYKLKPQSLESNNTQPSLDYISRDIMSLPIETFILLRAVFQTGNMAYHCGSVDVGSSVQEQPDNL